MDHSSAVFIFISVCMWDRLILWVFISRLDILPTEIKHCFVFK